MVSTKKENLELIQKITDPERLQKIIASLIGIQSKLENKAELQEKLIDLQTSLIQELKDEVQIYKETFAEVKGIVSKSRNVQ